MIDLLPAPTPAKLMDLRHAHGWSAREAAAAFWYPDGRAWRKLEAGDMSMDGVRWTLGMLALDKHPAMTLGTR